MSILVILHVISANALFVRFSDYIILTSLGSSKLLEYRCMLLGHHMRGLEYRLQLSCSMGILILDRPSSFYAVWGMAYGLCRFVSYFKP